MIAIADVDSERMLLRVERGKDGRYRNAMLSQNHPALQPACRLCLQGQPRACS
jgi:hypothetical protein